MSSENDAARGYKAELEATHEGSAVNQDNFRSTMPADTQALNLELILDDTMPEAEPNVATPRPQAKRPHPPWHLLSGIGDVDDSPSKRGRVLVPAKINVTASQDACSGKVNETIVLSDGEEDVLAIDGVAGNKGQLCTENNDSMDKENFFENVDVKATTEDKAAVMDELPASKRPVLEDISSAHLPFPIRGETEQQNIGEEVCVVSIIVRPSDLDQLKKKSCGRVMLIQTGHPNAMQKHFDQLKQFYDAGLPGNAKRLSDASSLSSVSGNGYLAGSSSGSSNLSSKRDRYSINPDAVIEAHRVLSPLPSIKRFPCPAASVLKEESPLPTQNETQDIVQQQCTTNEQKEQDDKVLNSSSTIIKVQRRGRGRPPKSWAKVPKSSSPLLDTQAEKFLVGTKVFAKWQERTKVRYWPGVIEGINDGDKYDIKFLDGCQRLLREDELIRADALEAGHQVNVSSDEERGFYNEAVLLSYADLSRPDDLCYTVEFARVDNLPMAESQSVSFSMVHLSDDQAKKIKQDLGLAMASSSISNVSLDNVVSSKRRPKTLTPTPSSAKPKATPRSRKKKGGELVDSSTFSTTEADSAPETGGVRRAAARILNFSTTTTTTTDDDDTQGSQSWSKPNATASASLFEGMQFLLTQSLDRSYLLTDEPKDHSGMDSETESDEQEPVASGMQKKLVRRIIAENGGLVLDEFPGSKKKVPSDLIVISDRYSKTMTYLLAMAFGCQLISYQWVLNSVSCKTRLPLRNYVLPVGFSTVQQREIEQRSLGDLRNLFQSMHIVIAASDKNFSSDWKPLLARLGASISFRSQGTLSDRALGLVHLVLADTAEPPASILKDAKAKHIPVVTAMWVIQSLINGMRLPPENFKLA